MFKTIFIILSLGFFNLAVAQTANYFNDTIYEIEMPVMELLGGSSWHLVSPIYAVSFDDVMVIAASSL